MLTTKFRVNLHLGLEEEAKNIFSRWPPWPLMLPTMFGVNWLLGLGEEAKNRFAMAAILDFQLE